MFAEERPQGQAMQGISIFAYTRSSVPYACSSLDSVSDIRRQSLRGG